MLCSLAFLKFKCRITRYYDVLLDGGEAPPNRPSANGMATSESLFSGGDFRFNDLPDVGLKNTGAVPYNT